MNKTNNDNKKRYEDVIRNEFPKLIEIFESCLDFKHWGFELTHTGVFPQYLPYIIYRSKQCKIRFRWEQDRPYEESLIYVHYGRSHAPIDQNFMVWNEEKFYCWHRVETVINFLDGLSPSDINNREFIVPQAVKDFYQSNKDKGLSRPEFTARSQAFLWNRYGQRLFDLFDLRRPDLWNEYINFLKDYHTNRDEQNKLKGIPTSSVNPPLYKVC
jgi:hypothetical protein